MSSPTPAETKQISVFGNISSEKYFLPYLDPSPTILKVFSVILGGFGFKQRQRMKVRILASKIVQLVRIDKKAKRDPIFFGSRPNLSG
jgi:hypothetical protein